MDAGAGAGAVAFFDIGDTLAAVSLPGSGDRIELTAFPGVREVLDDLRARGVRLGVVSDPGPIPPDEVTRALKDAGLGDHFETDLLVYGRKDAPRIFERAAERAGAPRRRLFVGEDAAERSHALRAGFLVAPHPRLAVPVLEQQALRFLRITAPPDDGAMAALRDLAVVPLHVTGPAGTVVHAVATAAAAARLDDLGFLVDRLGAEDLPDTTDLYLLRDDRAQLGGNSARFFEAGPPARGVLASTADGLLVAVAAGESVESYHFRGAQHGHNLKLVPLVETVGVRAGLPEAPLAPVTIEPAEREVLDTTVRAEKVGEHVERYSGARPAGDGVVITSRHVHHAGNAAAVTALLDDLAQIGAGRFGIRRHRFTHEGRPLDNVEAELPGTGLDGIVLVTAHLDSTGARAPGYRPDTDPAPGADDDASGVAGVLAAAEAVVALDAALARPRRAVRFVLFNAEEHGLVGSRAYAREQAVLGAPIVAVLQLDMIGYDVRPERTFELHAGFGPAPAVEADSLALARRVAELVAQVSPALPAPQLYPLHGEPDPAERRSDHYSFQLQGYPACLASEDLFAGPGPDAPPEEMNPQYHLPSDLTIDTGYAADIARVVTAAAWVAATR